MPEKPNWRRESDPEKGRVLMSGPATALKAHTAISIHGQGKLSLAPDPNAPLLVVFGGIDVDGIHSGVYMWNYMNHVKERFHIFVALHSHVNGSLAYRSLMSTVQANGLTPAKQILYLFSGGYKPGMDVLTIGGPSLFSSIYLVDIWMKGSNISDFYKGLVNGNAGKITYVYTLFGANNDGARDYIASKLGARAILIQGHGMPTHMRTNTMAVNLLQ